MSFACLLALFSISELQFGVSICFAVIFKVYDSDCNGKVAFSDMLDVLRDLTGQFISEQQREVGFYHKFASIFYFSYALIWAW